MQSGVLEQLSMGEALQWSGVIVGTADASVAGVLWVRAWPEDFPRNNLLHAAWGSSDLTEVEVLPADAVEWIKGPWPIRPPT